MTDDQWEKFETWMTTQTSELRSIKRHVVGESEPERSLVYRVARIEEQNRRQAWWMRAIGTGLFGTIGTWIASRFLGGPHA